MSVSHFLSVLLEDLDRYLAIGWVEIERTVFQGTRISVLIEWTRGEEPQLP